ncbi:MAG: beta-ketoacyl-[acyl-carrier-protein] synthase family protein [Flavobacteriales bacterium]|nr:3-oxoacyl-[acyl-carrier-protein] synthase 2 [Flavobacteriales bacterium]MCC6578028.1 beta-ketoacyl-[acyl-carrier-protein] synthase family protein [Flavobacteriales bacterium]
MKPTPVAITGIGAISALGTGIAAQLEGLREGRSGIGRLAHLPLPFPELWFGEVKASNADLATLAGVEAEHSRTVLLGLIAAREALQDAGLGVGADIDLLSASTVGGMDRSEAFATRWMAGGLDGIDRAMGHAVGHHAHLLARHLGLRGRVTTLSTACSSSANALMLGSWLLRSGRAEVVLAGGTDALCRFTSEGFRALSAMDPAPCRPFSADRGGMNLGEGAAYLVLERADRALARGRTPLAFLAGAANTNDAHHQTATSPEGDGPFRAMQEALAEAGRTPDQVDLINAHGTGTDNNDSTEQLAMERLFATVPPFASTKSATGHTLAAAGALEAVFSVLCIRHGLIPANLRSGTPIEGMRSAPDRVPRRATVRTVLSTSFGFGGNDSALVLTATP